MGVPMSAKAVGIVGGLLFATGGAVMGSMNAGWMGLEGNANALFPLLGLGTALFVIAWVLAGWVHTLWRGGPDGVAAVVLLVIAPILYLASWLIEFAILGTLALGLGLVLLALTMWRNRWANPADRVLVTLAAVGALTWNTETLSAFLLVGVGLVWAVFSLRWQRPPQPATTPT
jgi:hypothetical protein